MESCVACVLSSSPSRTARPVHLTGGGRITVTFPQIKHTCAPLLGLPRRWCISVLRAPAWPALSSTPSSAPPQTQPRACWLRSTLASPPLPLGSSRGPRPRSHVRWPSSPRRDHPATSIRCVLACHAVRRTVVPSCHNELGERKPVKNVGIKLEQRPFRRWHSSLSHNPWAVAKSRKRFGNEQGLFWCLTSALTACHLVARQITPPPLPSMCSVEKT